MTARKRKRLPTVRLRRARKAKRGRYVFQFSPPTAPRRVIVRVYMEGFGEASWCFRVVRFNRKTGVMRLALE